MGEIVTNFRAASKPNLKYLKTSSHFISIIPHLDPGDLCCWNLTEYQNLKFLKSKLKIE